MTREEAIEELKAILEMQYWNVPLSKAALEMAIKALQQEPTTKDNSEVIEMLEILKTQARHSFANTFIWDVTLESFNFVITRAIESLVQEPQSFKWCTDCKEYDQEKHCCHRWSKVIRDAVEEMKPKTGHWIGHREHCENLGVMPSGLGAYEWCSNCDCAIDVREWHRNHYNYCPNCGTKMIGSDK